MELLREKGMSGVPVFAGGIIPDEDIPTLKQMGVIEIFQPGSSLEKVVELVRNQCS
jgi:methylmalonyl-CoA mutase C-terminal domain/subunit